MFQYLDPGTTIWTMRKKWFLASKASTRPAPAHDDTKVKPGQVFHLNYSVEYEFFKNFRAPSRGTI